MTVVKKLLPVLAPLLLLWATSAFADDDVACNPDGTQMEMNACSFDDLQKADDELNAVYREAMAFAKSEDAKTDPQSDDESAVAILKKAQRDWIKTRDRKCGEPSSGGGSMQSMEIASCRTELTQARTEELRSMLEEGRAANEDAESEGSN
ncbi:lysozyme inhibitor LprI family protein [Rhizobium sp. C4]|uniref:lysozyme inhibitor LprI family protein n=1 Tax=Rhizobium sp. C4 TaxID=1349800 RepID=UPI001E490E0D|nr:lysozyme inhibitor LprI family protein [Rhizobium sp. C4]MCD2173807.1 lysozyme inhibitor LprI family protein [Rhizobium sp. C4]